MNTKYGDNWVRESAEIGVLPPGDADRQNTPRSIYFLANTGCRFEYNKISLNTKRSVGKCVAFGLTFRVAETNKQLTY
jgi:hypothetical protein